MNRSVEFLKSVKNNTTRKHVPPFPDIPARGHPENPPAEVRRGAHQETHGGAARGVPAAAARRCVLFLLSTDFN